MLAGAAVLQVVPAGAATTSSVAATSAGVTAAQGWLDDQESRTHVYTAAQAVQQAQRFSIISALPNTYAPYVAAMKVANPKLRIFVYMNGTMASTKEATAGLPESWYLHDASGRRITNAWHLFLMNPANAGWVSNRASTCTRLITQSGYDGCFLDNLGSGTWYAGTVSAAPLDPATGKKYLPGAWLARTAALAQAVHTSTGRLVFANGLVSGRAYFSPSAPSKVLSDGSDLALAETFIRTAGMGITQYRSVTAWKQDVDMLAQAAAQGKRVAVLTKVWASGTQQQIDDWHAFAAGSFLLGTNGQQVFEFSGSPTADISAGSSVIAKLTALGAATGAYSVVNGIYQRQFTGGLVIVNPTTAPLTATLSQPYTDAISGAAVTGTITIRPHTAQLLLG